MRRTVVGVSLLAVLGMAAIQAARPTAEVGPPRVHLVTRGQPIGLGQAGGEVAQIVAIGDSVLAARRCGCPGALVDYSHLIGALEHRPALLVNAADGAVKSWDVLAQVNTWPTLRADLSAADIVVIMVGANNFTAPYKRAVHGEAGTDAFAPAAERLRRDVVAIINAVRALRGAPTHFQVLGYWNVFRDGAVAAQRYTPQERTLATDATEAANAALAAAAREAGADWVPLVAAFSSGGDPTAVLESDGNHPNAAGHELIGRELFHAYVGRDAASAAGSPMPARAPAPQAGRTARTPAG